MLTYYIDEYICKQSWIFSCLGIPLVICFGLVDSICPSPFHLSMANMSGMVVSQGHEKGKVSILRAIAGTREMSQRLYLRACGPYSSASVPFAYFSPVRFLELLSLLKHSVQDLLCQIEELPPITWMLGSLWTDYNKSVGMAVTTMSCVRCLDTCFQVLMCDS